jgi:hypothetical protein
LPLIGRLNNKILTRGYIIPSLTLHLFSLCSVSLQRLSPFSKTNMPSLKIIRPAVAQLSQGQPLVAVLVGGTTGIGSYVAKSLARAFAKNGSKLRVYVVGRNATRAAEVIAQGRSISPGSDWRFIQATDLALISEVDKSCAEIIRQETESPFQKTPGIDLLYMSHCYPILKEPTSKCRCVP